MSLSDGQRSVIREKKETGRCNRRAGDREKSQAGERMGDVFLLRSDQLSVGQNAIDNEHKQLLAIVNDLHRALTEGHEKEIFAGIPERLMHYTRVHFAREEAMLFRCGYPQATEHKQEHEAMLHWVEHEAAKFRSGDAGAVSNKTLAYLRDWFYDHIGRIDQRYVPFVKAAGIQTDVPAQPALHQ